MSKSTSLRDLQNNTEEQHESLVGDIIKEINEPESQDNSSEYAVQQENALAYQLDSSVKHNSTEESDLDNNNQEDMMDYQNENTIEELSHSEYANVPSEVPSEIDNITQNIIQGNGINTMTPEPKVSTMFKLIKDPLLVVLLSILLSIPVVNQMIVSSLSKIPGCSNPMVPILVQPLLTGILFFSVRNLI